MLGKMNYAVLDDVEQIVVILENGKIGTAYHNDEHIVLNWYGTSIPKNFVFDTIWEELNEGRRYWKDLKEKQEINKEIINVIFHTMYGEAQFNKDITVECFDEEDLRAFLNKN